MRRFIPNFDNRSRKCRSTSTLGFRAMEFWDIQVLEQSSWLCDRMFAISTRLIWQFENCYKPSSCTWWSMIDESIACSFNIRVRASPLFCSCYPFCPCGILSFITVSRSCCTVSGSVNDFGCLIWYISRYWLVSDGRTSSCLKSRQKFICCTTAKARCAIKWLTGWIIRQASKYLYPLDRRWRTARAIRRVRIPFRWSLH
jgi:hypothetical protein